MSVKSIEEVNFHEVDVFHRRKRLASESPEGQEGMYLMVHGAFGAAGFRRSRSMNAIYGVTAMDTGAGNEEHTAPQNTTTTTTTTTTTYPHTTANSTWSATSFTTPPKLSDAPPRRSLADTRGALRRSLGSLQSAHVRLSLWEAEAEASAAQRSAPSAMEVAPMAVEGDAARSRMALERPVNKALRRLQDEGTSVLPHAALLACDALLACASVRALVALTHATAHTDRPPSCVFSPIARTVKMGDAHRSVSSHGRNSRFCS